MSVAEVTGASGINRAAAYRILTTLERRGYVLRTHDEVRRYLLGPALRTLVRGATSLGDVLIAARPQLRRLWEEFGETVNLGAFSQRRVLYLDILESEQGLRTTVTVGTHDDLHSTALGKAILAALPPAEVRDLLTAGPLVRKTSRTLTSLARVVDDVELSRRARLCTRRSGERAGGALRRGSDPRSRRTACRRPQPVRPGMAHRRPDGRTGWRAPPGAVDRDR